MKGQKVLMLDKEDLLILDCLCENCRISYRDIGAKINMSGEGVHRRIKIMKKCGYIEKFTIELSEHAKLEIKYLKTSVICVENDEEAEQEIDKEHKEVAERLGFTMVT